MKKKTLVMTGEALRNHAKGPATLNAFVRIEKHPPPADIRGLPTIEEEKCILCGMCIKVCPTGCLGIDKASGKEGITNGMIWIFSSQCMTCGHCQTYCPKDAIHCDGGQWFQPSFDIRMEYQMLTAKGSYKEKVDEKMAELKAEGEKNKKEIEEFRGI